MKVFRFSVLAPVLLSATLPMVTGISNSVSAQTSSSKSVNGFFYPQCTWGADTVTYNSGWRLIFSRTYNRDARRWLEPGLIRNGYISRYPSTGSIMTLDTSSSGHVAYIADVYSDNTGFYVLTLQSNLSNPPGSGFKGLVYLWWQFNSSGSKIRPIYSNGNAGSWVSVLGYVRRLY